MGKRGTYPTENASVLLQDMQALPVKPPVSISENPDLAENWRLFRNTITKVDHVRAVHAPLVIQLCRAVSLADDAFRNIERDGVTPQEFAIWKGATETISRLLKDLNLTPTAIQAVRCPGGKIPKEAKGKERESDITDLNSYFRKV